MTPTERMQRFYEAEAKSRRFWGNPPPGLTAEQRQYRARLGAYATLARHDPVQLTEKARQTFRESFRLGHSCKLCKLVLIPPDLLPQEIDRRAGILRKAHFMRLATSSAKARKARA